MLRFLFGLFLTFFSSISLLHANPAVIKNAQKIAQSSKVFILNFAIDELYQQIDLSMKEPYIQAIVIHDVFMDENIIVTYKENNGLILHKQNLPESIKKYPYVKADVVDVKSYDKTKLATLTLYYDSKFAPKMAYNDVSFSEEEKNYLAAKKSIKMCVHPKWLPFEALDKNGEHVGIVAEILELMQKNSGIRFEVVPTKSWEETVAFSQERKCDITSLGIKTQKRNKYLKITSPYISFPLVAVTKNSEIFINSIEDLFDKKIAIVKGYGYIDILKKAYPKIKIIEVNNLKDGIKKVRENRVYAYIDALPPLAYMFQSEGIHDVKISGKIEDKLFLGMGVRNDEPRLFSIIEKSLKGINQESVQKINNKWLAIKFEDRIDYTLVYQILCVFFIISLFALWRYYEMRKVNLLIMEKNKELEEAYEQSAWLAVTDRLTKLYNRYKLDEELQANVELASRYENSFGVIMIDIDYFKKVNDNYGHQVGDKVLQALASLLKENSRKSDIVGRWGGEEFMIIVPHATKESILAFAQNLAKEISESYFEGIGHLTVSMGISLYQEEELSQDVVKRADKALYISKNSGRDCINFL